MMTVKTQLRRSLVVLPITASSALRKAFLGAMVAFDTFQTFEARRDALNEAAGGNSAGWPDSSTPAGEALCDLHGAWAVMHSAWKRFEASWLANARGLSWATEDRVMVAARAFAAVVAEHSGPKIGLVVPIEGGA